MLFSLVIIVTVGVVAFFHYIQGFFSATISAVLAAVAALLALSFYEPAVNALLGGKMADSAHGMVLLVLFAAFYMIPRVMFDKMVPGNLRLPAIVDKVGGAAMGAVAGLFGAGVVAIAAQAFPFMPDVGGYTKYAVNDTRPVQIPAPGSGGRSKDGIVYDEVIGDESGRFDEAKRASMILPADDIVMSILTQHSTGGALGSRPVTDVHPDLLQEYFGQRLGIQTGAPRVVFHNPAKNRTAIRSVELYRLDAIPQVDAGYAVMRPPDRKGKVAKELRAAPSQVLLVVRAFLGRDAGDPKYYLMRFSPGSVRLVAGRVGASGTLEQANYFPVGTIDGARQLHANRIDDFMLADVREDRAVDFAFLVDRDGLLAQPAAAAAGPGGAPAGPVSVKPGVFLEINRMAVEDLSGKEVRPPSAYAPNPQVEVKRPQPEVRVVETPPPPAAPVAPTEPTPPPAPAVPLKDKLVGTWAGKAANGADLTLTFNADGKVAYTIGAQPGEGTWTAQNEENPTTLNITRKLGAGEAAATKITFSGDDAITMTTAAGQSTAMTRKK